MTLVISELKVPLDADDGALRALAAEAAGCKATDIAALRVLRQSVDARKKKDVHLNVQAALSLPASLETEILKRSDRRVAAYMEAGPEEPRFGTNSPRGRIAVVGMGPAGLFAALTLARYGYKPLVIERGKPVEARVSDVERYFCTGRPDPESNVLFGEGGAGTFSDGKLTTRVKDPRVAEILETWIRCGAPEEIRAQAKPHIGTDVLRTAVANLRGEILAAGGEIRFSTKLSGVTVQDGVLTAIRVGHAGLTETIPCAAVILAIGQGAEDSYRMLMRAGVPFAAKPFAVGVRAEHPQAMIDRAQYGGFAGHPRLGAAEYRMTGRSGERGVYTFCMCPGGFVIGSASAPDAIIVNGMSNHARDGENANAAIVVQVFPTDIGGDPEGALRFRRALERNAYLVGGADGSAPASTVGDFMEHRPCLGFSDVLPSCRPHAAPADLWNALPDFVAKGVADGIRAFGAQLRGYDRPDAVLTAVESRTSAPVRILRNADMQSVGAGNLYPVGEGAGYAGGIMSAAADGVRAAEQVMARYKAG